MSSQPPEPSARRRSQLAWWLLPLLILAAGGYGWHLWQQHRAADVGTAAAAARIGTLEARLDALWERYIENLRRELDRSHLLVAYYSLNFPGFSPFLALAVQLCNHANSLVDHPFIQRGAQ